MPIRRIKNKPMVLTFLILMSLIMGATFTSLSTISNSYTQANLPKRQACIATQNSTGSYSPSAQRNCAGASYGYPAKFIYGIPATSVTQPSGANIKVENITTAAFVGLNGGYLALDLAAWSIASFAVFYGIYYAIYSVQPTKKKR